MAKLRNEELKDQTIKPDNDYSDDFESSDSGDARSCGNEFEDRSIHNEGSLHSSNGDYSDDFEDYESDDNQVKCDIEHFIILDTELKSKS